MILTEFHSNPGSRRGQRQSDCLILSCSWLNTLIRSARANWRKMTSMAEPNWDVNRVIYGNTSKTTRASYIVLIIRTANANRKKRAGRNPRHQVLTAASRTTGGNIMPKILIAAVPQVFVVTEIIAATVKWESRIIWPPVSKKEQTPCFRNQVLLR